MSGQFSVLPLGSTLWKLLSAIGFLGTSLREWLLCTGVISYKGEEESCSLSWDVGAEASLHSCSTSPQGRAVGHSDFHLVWYSVNLCFLLNPTSFCIPTIKTIYNSGMTSRFR